MPTDKPERLSAPSFDPEMPIISLWMPWANWVVLGWKGIETRLHRRFYGLVGKEIGIHATQKWDETALAAAKPYLWPPHWEQSHSFLKIGGAIIGTACVVDARELTEEDSPRALIDCGNVKRHGLYLAYPKSIEAIPAKGNVLAHEQTASNSVKVLQRSNGGTSA